MREEDERGRRYSMRLFNLETRISGIKVATYSHVPRWTVFDKAVCRWKPRTVHSQSSYFCSTPALTTGCSNIYRDRSAYLFFSRFFCIVRSGCSKTRKQIDRIDEELLLFRLHWKMFRVRLFGRLVLLTFKHFQHVHTDGNYFFV